MPLCEHVDLLLPSHSNISLFRSGAHSGSMRANICIMYSLVVSSAPEMVISHIRQSSASRNSYIFLCHAVRGEINYLVHGKI